MPCVGGKTVATVGHKNAKGMRLSTKTVRSHVMRELHDLMHEGGANNGQDCVVMYEPKKCDLNIT